MPGYRLPAASASSAEHHEACKSSLAREMQSWKFAEEQGIEGLVAGEPAEHRLLHTDRRAARERDGGMGWGGFLSHRARKSPLR